MTFFTWNMINFTRCMGRNSRNFVQEFVFKMETEVRGRVWFFDENPDINGALYSWFYWSSVFTQYYLIQCVLCHFLAIFYRENADMSMELQDFLLVWCYTQGEGHWLCLFFSKKNAILEFRKYTRRDMK